MNQTPMSRPSRLAPTPRPGLAASVTRSATRVIVAALSLALLAACGSDGTDASARVLSVPGDYATIQAAVDAGRPGDLVLVEPGIYHEAVVVDRPGLTIRGTDRNSVVLDGDSALSNGIEVTESGVSIENLTLTGYRFNGVIVNGADGEYRADGSGSVDGYRIDYVTAYNNGLYGVYAFAAVNGTISNSYASGHPDSGFYVGQCKPCNVVLSGLTAELNAIGYYGTNASGGVYVVESTFIANRLGIAPNSQDAELLAPQSETVIAGNDVSGAGAAGAPEIPQGHFGGGIAVGGGNNNAVLRNRVVDHDAYGIGLVALGAYDPADNRVEGNLLERNAIDLVYAPGQTVAAAGNCFVDNSFSSSLPLEIEQALPCTGSPAATPGDQPAPAVVAPPGPRSGEVPTPAPQPVMPNPVDAPALLAGPPVVPDIDAIALPNP